MMRDEDFDLLTPSPAHWISHIPDAVETVEKNLREILGLLTVTAGAAGDLYMGFLHKADENLTEHAKLLMQLIADIERETKKAEEAASVCHPD